MIVVKNLTMAFGDRVVIDNVSFEVSRGEIFAFLGPNGAGKTTTVKILTTLLTASGGSIRIDGLDLAREQGEIRKRFGIVFQDPSLDRELTAYENLDLHGVLYNVPRAARRERIRSLLEMFDLWARRDELVAGFSGGMMRRLEIARGLLHKPRILYLDEPTAGLDPQSRNQLWSYIRELNRSDETTVFLTTHYMEEAERVASRIGVIDHGKIVAIGSPVELKQRTRKNTLEEAFLSLTGTAVRQDTDGGIDELRQHDRLWRAR